MGLIIILAVALLVVGILGAVVYIIISKGKEKHLLEDDKGLGSDLSSSQNMLSSTSDVNPLLAKILRTLAR